MTELSTLPQAGLLDPFEHNKRFGSQSKIEPEISSQRQLNNCLVNSPSGNFYHRHHCSAHPEMPRLSIQPIKQEDLGNSAKVFRIFRCEANQPRRGQQRELQEKLLQLQVPLA